MKKRGGASCRASRTTVDARSIYYTGWTRSPYNVCWRKLVDQQRCFHERGLINIEILRMGVVGFSVVPIR